MRPRWKYINAYDWPYFREPVGTALYFAATSVILGTHGGGGGDGTSGYSGTSGFSGVGFSGYSGALGISGLSGFSGKSGFSGIGVSGFSGFSGFSGAGFTSGSDITVGKLTATSSVSLTAYAGVGVRALNVSPTGDVFPGSGVSGYSGVSGFSGFSGAGVTVNASAGDLVYWDGSALQDTGFNYDGESVIFRDDGEIGLNLLLANSIQANDNDSIGFASPIILYVANSDPTGTIFNGTIYYNNISNTVRFYNGSTWVSLASGGMGTSGFSGVSGYSGYSGKSGFSGVGTSGFSGFSGVSVGGTSGFSGATGSNGSSGFSGLSGYSGVGTSGFSGFSGVSVGGTSGFSGASGFSGVSGFSGYSGKSGFSGISGYSGFSGVGTSGFSGYSGIATSGFSGYSGATSTSGFSGYSGASGISGYSGFSGRSGFSGTTTDPVTGGTTTYSVSGSGTATVTLGTTNNHEITATGNFTLAFSGGVNSQKVLIKVLGSGTTVSITAGTNVAFGSGFTGFTTVASGKIDLIAAIYSTMNSVTKLYILSQTPGF